MHNISHKYPFLHGAYHLEYYIPRNTGQSDQLSEDVIQFKKGNQQKVREWCNKASHHISGIISPTIIVRALGSNETIVSGQKPLDQLGLFLASQTGASYQPQILSKASTNPPLKGLGKSAREGALQGLYKAEKLEIGESPSFLVIDDIITTGSTIKEIQRTLIGAFPNAKVYFLALAKTKSPGFSDEVITTHPIPPPPPQPDRPRLGRYDRERANRMGLSDEQVINIRTKYSNFGRRWFDDDIRKLVELAVEGNTVGIIASSLGRTDKSVRIKLDETTFGRNTIKHLDLTGDKIPEILREHWKKELLKTNPRFRYPPPAPSSGCFIATAVYGDYDHFVVKEFRRFRDETLLRTKIGGKIVKFYYSLSPLLVPMIKRSSFFKQLLNQLLLMPAYRYLSSNKRHH
jgi:hypothetical protein